MLGNVMRAAIDPPRGEVSTRMADALRALQRPDKAIVVPEGARTAADIDFWLSASNVTHWCPRLCALAVRARRELRDPVDGQLLWTFAQGTGYHRAFQDELLPGLGPVLQGAWERTQGDTVERAPTPGTGPWVERGWGPRPEGMGWRFVEPKGRIPACRVVGKWDAVLGWGDVPPEVWELKSIRADLFRQVDPRAGGHPREDHLPQVQIYLWMSGLSWARLTYVAKGEDDLVKAIAEHVIPRDEPTIRWLEDRALACVAAVEGELAGAPLPAPLPEGCRIRSDKRARKCPGKALCFDARKAAA